MEELTGTVERVRYVSKDGTYIVAQLESEDQSKQGTTVVGDAPKDGLTCGLTYLFRGYWTENQKYGRQFKFNAAIQKTANTRSSVVKYLVRYAKHIGEAIAHSIVDRYGAEDAVRIVRSDPERVSKEIRGLTLERSKAAAAALREHRKYEETRIRLVDLLAKREFGEAAIKACIEKWGIHAPDVIRRDPFKMMTARIPRAGFLRCDQLWVELGLSPDRMKRQVMAAIYYMQSDSSGSTWYPKAKVMEAIRNWSSEISQPERAIAIAIRARRMVQVEHKGQLWLADWKKAKQEDEAAAHVIRILHGNPNQSPPAMRSALRDMGGEVWGDF